MIFLFFIYSAPEINNSLEYFYGHFLQFKNSTYAIKDLLTTGS